MYIIPRESWEGTPLIIFSESFAGNEITKVKELVIMRINFKIPLSFSDNVSNIFTILSHFKVINSCHWSFSKDGSIDHHSG